MITIPNKRNIYISENSADEEIENRRYYCKVTIHIRTFEMKREKKNDNSTYTLVGAGK